MLQITQPSNSVQHRVWCCHSCLCLLGNWRIDILSVVLCCRYIHCISWECTQNTDQRGFPWIHFFCLNEPDEGKRGSFVIRNVSSFIEKIWRNNYWRNSCIKRGKERTLGKFWNSFVVFVTQLTVQMLVMHAWRVREGLLLAKLKKGFTANFDDWLGMTHNFGAQFWIF